MPISAQDRKNTTFVTHRDAFCWIHIPFGLLNGPANFQGSLYLILYGVFFKTCLVNLDKVLIFSSKFEEHINEVD